MIERQEAYSVIYKVLKKNKFSSSLLNKQAKKIKTQEGNHEFFYTLVKGVIKRKGYLEYVASSFGHPKKYSKTDLKVKVLLYLGYYQLMYLDSVPDHSAVDETVKLAKTLYNQRTADFVNAMLRSYLRKPNIELPTEPIPRIAIEHSYPTELISSWVDIYGLENAEYLAMYFNEFPDINIRVNTYATTLEKLLKYFNNRDIELRTYPGIKNVFRAKDAQKALNDVGFSEGYYSIQDAAASLVVDLLDPLPKES
ncbi:MAG: 16S rRNA methyltransferase, partial [Candidatus Cloacimonetes bacterium 4572_65]